MAKKEEKVVTNNGKSKSREHRFGVRQTEAATGKLLAPRSIRKGTFGRKHRYLDKCKEEQLRKAGVMN